MVKPPRDPTAFGGKLDGRGRLILDEMLSFETSSQLVAEKIVELIDKIRG
jgi:hypothetical protein